jgi:hypothetical protein
MKAQKYLPSLDGKVQHALEDEFLNSIIIISLIAVIRILSIVKGVFNFYENN